MKLIISSTGPAPTDRVDPRFGRASYFLSFDSETGDFQAIDNAEQVDAPQGAGVQTAQMVAGMGATAVLTGRCGPKAFQVLTEADVTIYSGFEGSVQEAVDSWLDGGLEPLRSPDGKSRH